MGDRSTNVQGRGGSRLFMIVQRAILFPQPLRGASGLLRTCLFLSVMLGWSTPFVSPAQVAAAPGKRIAVITSRDVPASRQALQGFTATVPHRIVAKHDLGGDPGRAPAILEQIRSETRPDLLFVVGTQALQAAAGRVRDIPMVYAMVLNPPAVIPRDVKNVTGASMNVPLDRTMQVLKELSPKFRRVGVIFNPENTGYLVKEAAGAAREQGLQLVSRGVRSTGEAIRALDGLKGKVDALWMVPDPTILADEFVTATYLFSYRNKVPVIGVSETHTDKGALLSLGFGSTEDIGKQAGEIANAILRGKNPAAVPYTMARQVKVTVNPRGAKKLGVELPDEVLASASNLVQAPVYEEGDWWLYRVSIDGRVQEHRIEYRNGKFESDDAMFLRGEAYGFWYSNVLPWATVHLNDPQRQWVEFPIAVGNKWDARYQVGTGSFDADAEVIGRIPKLVETPAGRFAAAEISRLDQMIDHRPWGKLTYFYSPEAKSVVKLSAKYFVGLFKGMWRDSFELELIDYAVRTPPGQAKIATASPRDVSPKRSPGEFDWSQVEAPVYKEGDWWVYRASIDGVTEEHRIEYKNGRFHSQEPGFLRGEDISGAPRVLSWATVHIDDPRMRWLSFPLTTGKSWAFEYPIVHAHTGEAGIGQAHADAIGPTSQAINTKAGNFLAYEIRRTDIIFTWARLTYFYSPQTRSVVKLEGQIKAGTSGRSHRRFELELLSYNRRPSSTSPIVNVSVEANVTAQQVERRPYKENWNHVKAPNYEDGDWWAFQVKTGDEAQTYKFVRKNGVFASDIAFFTGKPSMVLSAGYQPTRDIHFPLQPGKKWNSRYRGPLTEFAFIKGLSWRSGLIESTGKVIGVKSEPIETAAGKFKVVEVRMLLRSGGRSAAKETASDAQELELIGFYCPETKSMVKLIGKLKGPKGAEGETVEIELVDYGRKKT